MKEKEGKAFRWQLIYDAGLIFVNGYLLSTEVSETRICLRRDQANSLGSLIVIFRVIRKRREKSKGDRP